MSTSTPAGGALSGLVRFVKGVLGEDAYEKYLQYHQSSNCADAPMTEREFWRDKMDRQDANPQGRCC